MFGKTASPSCVETEMFIIPFAFVFYFFFSSYFYFLLFFPSQFPLFLNFYFLSLLSNLYCTLPWPYPFACIPVGPPLSISHTSTTPQRPTPADLPHERNTAKDEEVEERQRVVGVSGKCGTSSPP
jgi:hypothetical protein